MKNFTTQGFKLSLKWVTLLQYRYLAKMFIVQVIALLLLLFLFTQNWLMPDSGDVSVPDAKYFEDTVVTTMNFCFLLLAPFMIVGTLHSLLRARSRQLCLMMPSTAAERYVAHILTAVVWLLVVYPLSFIAADLLRWLVFAAFGKGSLGMILTFNNLGDRLQDLLGIVRLDDITDAVFLTAWLLYVVGGWWCALFFNTRWLIAFGFFCIAYPCIFVLPASALWGDNSYPFFLILNLFLLCFISWHSWKLFKNKRMKKVRS